MLMHVAISSGSFFVVRASLEKVFLWAPKQDGSVRLILSPKLCNPFTFVELEALYFLNYNLVDQLYNLSSLESLTYIRYKK